MIPLRLSRFLLYMNDCFASVKVSANLSAFQPYVVVYAISIQKTAYCVIHGSTILW
jgi:hypothetical protein